MRRSNFHAVKKAALALRGPMRKIPGVFAVAVSVSHLFALLSFGAEGTGRGPSGHFSGSLTYYIADLKPSFPEHEMYSPSTALTINNYRAVLTGLKYSAGVNGVRLPVMPNIERAAEMSSLYKKTYAYARQLGLLIYASPASVGFSSYANWSDDRYASWLADYVNLFQPDVLSPFNESGIDNSRMARIVLSLRAKLGMPVKLAGPDRQHVRLTVESLIQQDYVLSLFDIIDSHNANRDFSASQINWAYLVRSAKGKPTWSSENPAAWGHGARSGLPGLDKAVLGGVSGIVVWMAKPTLVDDDGRPTAKAHEIAAHLFRADRLR